MTQLMEERVSEKVPQTQVDTVFYEMVDRMEGLRALSYRPDTERVLLEAQRDAILGELLEKNPHEAVGEIMHALSLLYRDRSITTYEGTMEITEFATRDASNPAEARRANLAARAMLVASMPTSL